MEKDRNDPAVTPVLSDFSWVYQELRRGAASIAASNSSGRTCDAAVAAPGTPMKNRLTLS
jgi:hypothetical protein